MKRIVSILLLSLLIAAGCSNKSNIKPPEPLPDFEAKATPVKLWETRVGDGAEDTGIRLRPTFANHILYVLSPSGVLEALDAKTGKILWHFKAEEKHQDTAFSGGPAVSDGLLVVGTLDGHVYGLSAKDGSQRWKTMLSAGIVSKPAIEDGHVVVRTNDGNVYSLDIADGQQQWVYDQGDVPLLSLRGNGNVLVTNGAVFFSSDAGKLEALRLDNGEKLWDIPLADNKGTTVIDRLGDADGSVLIDGRILYAASYQGRIVAVDGPTARPIWSQKFSTYTSMSVGNGILVAVDDASNVWAFDATSGGNLWEQKQLQWRWLSGAALQNGYVLVGGMEGYLNWLSPIDGSFVARTRLSHNAIRSRPLVVNDVAYVEDVSGHIAAYKISID